MLFPSGWLWKLSSWKYASVMIHFPPTRWVLWGKWASNSDNFMDMYISTAFWTLFLCIWLNCIQCCSTKCTEGLTQLWAAADLHFLCKSTSIASIFYSGWNSFSCAFYYSMKAQFLTSMPGLLLLILPSQGKKWMHNVFIWFFSCFFAFLITCICIFLYSCNRNY